MTLGEMTAKFAANKAVMPGKRIAFDFGDGDRLLLDGVADRVSNDLGAADLVVHVSLDDMAAVREGRLEPMSAYLSGRIRLDGDMLLAMRLRELLDKVGR